MYSSNTYCEPNPLLYFCDLLSYWLYCVNGHFFLLLIGFLRHEIEMGLKRCVCVCEREREREREIERVCVCIIVFLFWIWTSDLNKTDCSYIVIVVNNNKSIPLSRKQVAWDNKINEHILPRLCVVSKERFARWMTHKGINENNHVSRAHTVKQATWIREWKEQMTLAVSVLHINIIASDGKPKSFIISWSLRVKIT